MMIRSFFLMLLTVSSLQLTAQNIENTDWQIYDQFSAFVGTILFENGTMFVSVGGVELPIATYTLSGNTISVTDNDMAACNGAVGTYSYLIAPDTLHYTMINDACDDRAEVFLEYYWLSPSSTGIGASSVALELTIHPNPTNGDLFITRSSSEQLEISIYNLLGELIHRERSNQVRDHIQLGHLAKGTYMIQALTEQGSLSKRIVIE